MLFRNIIKKAFIAMVAILILFGVTKVDSRANTITNSEFRAVWICFFELGGKDTRLTESEYRKKVTTMLDNIEAQGFNHIFLHIRPFSDALHPSNYFPWSMYVSGKQGVNPGYDPLRIWIDESHKRAIKVHAWLNPMRVSWKTDGTDLCNDNPAVKWYNDDKKRKEGWVVKITEKKYPKDYIGTFYNPTVPEVRELIINGAKEIANKYPDIDGIHLDDYFYPTIDPSFDRIMFNRYLGKSDDTPWGKLTLQEQSKLPEFRRQSINKLVKGIYDAIKSANPNALFGISPNGNVDENYNELYADIYTWLSQPGYIDYIVPQIYWGFNHPLDRAKFRNCCQQWVDLVKNSSIKLYFGLALYKSGNVDADSTEWQENTDIIKRQIEHIRSIHNCSGFAIFSYKDIISDEEHHIRERDNYLSVVH